MSDILGSIIAALFVVGLFAFFIALVSGSVWLAIFVIKSLIALA